MKHNEKRDSHTGGHDACGVILAAMCVLSAVSAYAYQYIVTEGYDPVLYSTNTCSRKVSAGLAIDTGTLSLRACPSMLDARFRTWRESDGKALKSTKFKSLRIIWK